MLHPILIVHYVKRLQRGSLSVPIQRIPRRRSQFWHRCIFPQTPSAELIAEIERLTGTQLNITWVPEGVYTDKMNTALTTGSLGKVTFVKFTDYNPVKNMIRSGAFLGDWSLSGKISESQSAECGDS
ncbi:hypothetical protein ACFSQ7_09005 [Paenibacillus rhizoplanae]